MTRGRIRTTAATIAALLAAGTGAATAGPVAASAPPTGDGGALVVGLTVDADTLFPWKATQFQAVNILQNVYGTLTELDVDLNVVPGLAESWEVSDDGLTVTFHLREDVVFNDGSTFDAEDVVSSFTQIQEEDNAAVAASSLAAVESVEASDPATVVVTLSAPDAALPGALASVNLAILSSDDTEEALTATPNGTGPYAFDDRVASQSLTLVRNESYWGETPTLGSIEFRVIPEEASIASALQSGNVHLAVLNDPLVAETLGGDVTVTPTPQLSYHSLMLNGRRGDLADVNVRLAIQCAIDRQEVLDTAAFGEGEVTGPITSPAFLSDPAARPCPVRDLDRAGEYLAAADKADGVTFTAIVSTGLYATSVAQAENLQAQLADANITMEIETLESGTYIDRWVAADFDAAVALNGGRADPDTMYGRYFTSTGNLNEVAGYASDALDELFAAGKASSDHDERVEIYRQVSEELESNAAWIWLFSSYTYTATVPGVEGFVPMTNGSLQYLRTTTIS